MSQENSVYYNPTSVNKLIFLSILTFGIYDAYWFYKNWKFFKAKDDLEIRPFWRSVLSIFFVADLFTKIEEFTRSEGYEDTTPYQVLALGWIVLRMAGELYDPLWVLSFFAFAAVIKPLKAMNFYWEKNQPVAPVSSFRIWHAVVLIPFVILWIAIIEGLVLTYL